MQKYTTVEDYLEVIAGYKDPITLNRIGQFVFGMDPIISLARYDVSVIESMSDAASSGKALTERQGELACKIILKYARQLASKGIDVAPVNDPQWRIQPRRMDYTRSLYTKDDKLILAFPYNNELIDQVREFKKESQGEGTFNKTNRYWEFALTEYNLVWLHTWCSQNSFEISSDVIRLNDLITEAEKTVYKIELERNGDALTISNCPTTLLEYINETGGGLVEDNLLWLVDNSATLGYTVSSEIKDYIVETYGVRFYNITINKEIKLDPTALTTSGDIASVLNYADRVQRWPVVFYEPDMSGRLFAELTTLRDRTEFVEIKNKKNITVPQGVKYIYTPIPLSTISIPLMVSTAGMLFGGDKSLMIQNAEKIIYYAAEVYSKQGVKPITIMSNDGSM